MRSQLRIKINKIVPTLKGRIYYMDSRKKGYRLKFLFVQATNSQLKKIGALTPHITKVENIITVIPFRGSYHSLAIHIDCKLTEVTL